MYLRCNIYIQPVVTVSMVVINVDTVAPPLIYQFSGEAIETRIKCKFQKIDFKGFCFAPLGGGSNDKDQR